MTRPSPAKSLENIDPQAIAAMNSFGLKIPDDIKALCAMYHLFSAAQEAALGVSNRPYAECIEDAAEHLIDQLAWARQACAQKLSGVAPEDRWDLERKVVALTDWHSATGGTSNELAALALHYQTEEARLREEDELRKAA
jgi:hypothetical protein